MKFFQLNPHWISEPQKAIDYSISYSRRYAEYGDYRVSEYALNVIVEINALYIHFKGKTFFSNHPLMNHPLSSDEFINDTLENLRQSLSIGFSRKDEQLIEQTLNAFTKLAKVYIGIDYSNDHSSKQHASLATIYLSDGIKSALHHDFTDVVMKGLPNLGDISFALIASGSTTEVATIIDNIGEISSISVINKDHHPASLTGVKQIVRLTLILLQSKDLQITFPLNKIKRNILLVAKTSLKVSNPNLETLKGSNLAPYYSGTSNDTLQAYLTEITNTLIQADEDDEKATNVIRNIEEWADGIYQSEKELFLLVIEKRSHFVFDLICWISHLSKILLVLSETQACQNFIRPKLKRHTIWLFSIFSWIEDDPETIAFVANYEISENIFEMAIEARNRNAYDFAAKVDRILFDWAFKAGEYNNGLAILERSIYALAVLFVMGKNNLPKVNLIEKVEDHLSKNKLEQERLSTAAMHIRRKAENLSNTRNFGSSSSIIETYINKQDKGQLKSILEEIASIFEKQLKNT